MEQSGNSPIFNISRTLFGNIPRNFIGKFFRIFWEYIMRMFHEYSTNIYLPDGLSMIIEIQIMLQQIKLPIILKF